VAVSVFVVLHRYWPVIVHKKNLKKHRNNFIKIDQIVLHEYIMIKGRMRGKMKYLANKFKFITGNMYLQNSIRDSKFHKWYTTQLQKFFLKKLMFGYACTHFKSLFFFITI